MTARGPASKRMGARGEGGSTPLQAAAAPTDWPALQGEIFSSPAGRITLEAVRAHPPEAGWASFTLALRAEWPVAAGLLALRHPLTGTVWLHLERAGPNELRTEVCQPERLLR